MMHGVRFTSGGPSYVNRFVETKMYLENKKAGTCSRTPRTPDSLHPSIG